MPSRGPKIDPLTHRDGSGLRLAGRSAAAAFAFKEHLNRIAAVDEHRPISPLAVRRVGECDSGRIAAVPGLFGQSGFPCGGMVDQRGKGWAARIDTLPA
jgi:hypothetical protein